MSGQCWFFAGSVWFASEMKALSDDCERFVSFLPGHIYSSKKGIVCNWFRLNNTLAFCCIIKINQILYLGNLMLIQFSFLLYYHLWLLI